LLIMGKPAFRSVACAITLRSVLAQRVCPVRGATGAAAVLLVHREV
jgi:hypothetical protein